jgi:hypothetical protein
MTAVSATTIRRHMTRSLNGITLQRGERDYLDIAWCHFGLPQMVLQYADKYRARRRMNERRGKRGATSHLTRCASGMPGWASKHHGATVTPTACCTRL